MKNRKDLFLFLGGLIRMMPKIRGKVRLGLYCYKKLGLSREPFVIETTLFPEGLKFRLNLNCAHERMSYLMGHYEQETSAFLAEIYAGGTILDVGANVGLISVPLAVRTRSRASSLPHLYSVEALPGNFEALCRNVGLNDLDGSVVPIKIGLGSEEAQVSIQIEGNDALSTGTANILPDERDFVKIPLQIKTIDGLVEEGTLPGDISLVKIDTDGYDYEVLKGGRGLLEKQRPVVFAELSEHCMKWHGYGIREVEEYLQTVGYETWPMTGNRPIRFKRFEGPEGYGDNCLLVPGERAERFASYLC